MNIEIEKVINSFFAEMNKWEKFCLEIEEDENIPYEEESSRQKQEAKKIAEKFLTKKDRKRGFPNSISYGEEGSYKYNLDEEKIVNIEIEKNKSIVTTKREKPIQGSNQYVLKKIDGNWFIDSIKIYSSWKEKWENGYF